MRILLINKFHYLRGGAERAYFDMARILEAHGHEVAFFSMHHPENQATPWDKYFIDTIDYHNTKLSFQQKCLLAAKIIFNVDARRKLEELIKDFRPDIAHVHNIYHQLSPSIFWSLKKHRIPIVMTLHDYKGVSPNYSLFVRGKIWEHSSGLRCFLDRCVKDSYMKSAICALEGWVHNFLGSYTLIHAFIAPSHFLIKKYQSLGFKHKIIYLPHSLTELVQDNQIQPEQNSYLYFGRLAPEKGVDMLIEAFTLLDENQKLWIVGDGPERTRLEKMVQEKGLSKRVTFYGALYGNELETLKQRAEAILIPSQWYENFPYALIESLQSGCVVVASDRGGIAERITHGVNGLLFQASDVRSLVETIHSLTSIPLDTMRIRARESVVDLTEEVFALRLIEVYMTVLNTKK